MPDANPPDDPARPNPMAELVGPFYTAESAALMLGCAVGDLPREVSEGRLLAVQTLDGVDLYPRFQFDADGGLRDGLVPVLSLVAGAPAWSAAVWLRTANAALDGQSPEQAASDPAMGRLVQRLASQWRGDVTR